MFFYFNKHNTNLECDGHRVGQTSLFRSLHQLHSYTSNTTVHKHIALLCDYGEPWCLSLVLRPKGHLAFDVARSINECLKVANVNVNIWYLSFELVILLHMKTRLVVHWRPEHRHRHLSTCLSCTHVHTFTPSSVAPCLHMFHWNYKKNTFI